MNKDIGFVALSEQVICECTAARKGQELTSASGIVLGQRNQGDIPLYGTIVSIGAGCPDHIQELMGRNIPLVTGMISNIPDPRMAFGEIPLNSVESRIFVTMHHSAVRAVYNERPVQVQQPVAKKTLSLM